MILVHKGWPTRRHLVNQDSKSPPIYCETVTFLIQYLGCQILGSSTERVSLLGLRLQELSESEISEVNVARLIDQDILRFEISVHDAVIMKVAEGHCHLSCIEFDYFLFESLFVEQMIVQVATPHIL